MVLYEKIYLEVRISSQYILNRPIDVHIDLVKTIRDFTVPVNLKG